MLKKLFNLYLIFFTFLFLAKNISAYQFEKYYNNPLPLTYINNYTNQLQTNIFFEDNLYKGIVTINRPPETYHSLGYFESIDGINWSMKKEILSTGSDLSNPGILKTKTGYLLFFTRYDDNTIYRIYGSNCDFNFNCSINFFPIIIPNVSNYSENKGVFAGHTFQQDNRTYMFFGAWGTNGFKLKLAYSDDLLSWQRCQNEFLYGGDGPFPYQSGNELYLFFHRSDSTGIKYAKTSLPLSCDSSFIDQGYLLTKDKSYDQRHLIFPSVLNDNNGLKLYYSGLGSDFQWRLNLACVGQTCILPTPTLTPTFTPTPTPTLIPEKKPIIIIPGFLASWNKTALTHNAPQSQSNWKLNPIVHEYDGLINTLKNLGYEENKNLFVFTYDWRKPILEIVEDLKNFITNHLSPATNHFNIIGHSLGGLVSRIYVQKYNSSLVDSLITVGSPHRGATVSYKIVEAGQIERFNDYLWLAVKMISTLNKNNFETDKQTLNRLIPVMKDLFPVYNFLKKDNVEISVADMKIKNDLLSFYNSNLSNLSNLTNLTTLVGEKGDTLKGFNITNQTYFDKLFDNYPDGHPQSSFSEMGDHTVLSVSAEINSPTVLHYEHGELIYKKEAIKKILDLLNISSIDSEVVEGKGTVIDSSLLFLIKSPAMMEVIFNGQTYSEMDGLIFIENAQSGNYELKVKGTDSGNYEVIVGQIGKNGDVWDNIFGEIKPLKTDDYYIHYNNQTPEHIKINDLLAYLNIKQYKIKNLNNLEKVFHELIKNRDFIGLEKLENYLLNFESKNKHVSSLSEINNKLQNINKRLSKLKKPIDQVVLEQIVKRIDMTKKEIPKKNYRYCQILLDSIEKLLNIVKL